MALDHPELPSEKPVPQFSLKLSDRVAEEASGPGPVPPLAPVFISPVHKEDQERQRPQSDGSVLLPVLPRFLLTAAEPALHFQQRYKTHYESKLASRTVLVTGKGEGRRVALKEGSHEGSVGGLGEHSASCVRSCPGKRGAACSGPGSPSPVLEASALLVPGRNQHHFCAGKNEGFEKQGEV